MAERADERCIESQALRMIAAWHDLSRLGPRMKIVMPERLARFKERMREIHHEGGHRQGSDHALYYRISAVLAGRENPMAMGEISEALGVPANTATRMIDWLVKSGYAERMPDRDDRRVVRVSLTQEGRALHEALDEFALSHTRDLLRRFTLAERESLVALLQKLARVLEEEALET